MKKSNCLLPRSVRKDSHVTRSRQTAFGGLSSCAHATGQEIAHMKNMSPYAYPAIGTREKRFLYETDLVGRPHGIFRYEGVVVALGNALYSFDGTGNTQKLINAADMDKHMVSFGSMLFIQPDGICYDFDGKTVRNLSVTTGLLTEVLLGDDYITYEGYPWSQNFSVGDGVELYVKDYVLGSNLIFRCKIIKIVNGTVFFDKTFDVQGTYSIGVTRIFPAASAMCAVGDRLVSCVDHKVYVSEAGNPFNWCASDGSDAAPLTIATAGGGCFTACHPWQGYAILFKKDRIFQLLGRGADDYRVTEITAPGLTEKNARSLCEINGKLYYLSEGGVYCYDGNYPRAVGKDLPYGLSNGVGGSDGVCYYLSALGQDGMYHLYVYHTERDMWYEQDALQAVAMVQNGDVLYIQTAGGQLLRTAREGEKLPDDGSVIYETASAFMSQVIFGEEFGGTPDGLRLLCVSLRVDGEPGGELKVEIAYDGGEIWEPVGVLKGGTHGMVQLRLLPRRASSYRLRLSMTGRWRVLEMFRDWELGKQ